MSKFSKLSQEALFLGRIDRPGRRKWGRSAADALPGADEAVLFTGGQASHLLTIAPNRSGRDRSCLIPNLLNYAGQTVILDIDGRAYAATADARRAMGQSVMRLDPFGVTGPESDAYSPIDWMTRDDEPAFASACMEIASLFSPGTSFANAAEHEAMSLLSAIVGYLYIVPEKQSDNLYDTLHSDDVIYSLAVVLDSIGKKMSETSYSEIASFLEQDDRTRTRILAGATSLVRGLGSLEVQKTLHESAFEFPSQRPVTVYVILPAERLALHAALARLWIGLLMLRAARAPKKPSPPVLFLLDHCAKLGTLPLLESLHTMAPAGSLRIWTFWHDVHQLRAAYPRSWPTMLSGCGAVQVFGTSDPEAAAEAAAVLGLPVNDVRSLGPGDQIVRLDGVPRRVRRLSERDVTSRVPAAGAAMPAAQ